MTCRNRVDRAHLACNAWADEVGVACAAWTTQQLHKCTDWADEGSNACTQWVDQGHDECCDWWPCSWACDAWYWVADLVCVAWAWVQKVVCKAWQWVASLVCQAFAIVVKLVCVGWSWVAEVGCVVWDDGNCVLQGLFNRRRLRRIPVDRVFVLMLENRAFDHMLGFSGITATDAVTGATREVDGVIGKNLSNVDPAHPNVSVPPSIEADFKLRKPNDDDPGHEFRDTAIELCGTVAATGYTGGPYPPIDNSRFIESYATLHARDASKLFVPDPTTIMKCYSPARVPVLNALAAEFAVCDRWFASLPGPTWPNRFFMHAASSGGLDDSPSGPESASATLFDGYRFENGTIFDRLDDACLPWRVYAGDSFPVTLAISGMTINELQGRIADLDDFAQDLARPAYAPVYTFIEPDYGNDLPPSAEDFTCGNSQHPLDDVTRGERLIKDVYEAIRRSPHWNRSLLLVTYDEHGGFYDHVAPPAATPPGDPVTDPDNNHHDFDFGQLGVRVPAIVVSPLIPRGVVDGTVYDHTALLATLEELFGLRALTGRDASAATLTHLLSLGTARTDARVSLPDPATSDFQCDDDMRASRNARSIAADRPGTATGALDGPGVVREVPDPLRAIGTPLVDEGRDALPVPPAQRGFLRIALLKALAMARGRDRPRIEQAFLSIRTRGAARRFMYDVALASRLLGVRKSAPERGPGRPVR